MILTPTVQYWAVGVIVKENPQHGWGFQKALAMPSPAAAESLPCVRGKRSAVGGSEWQSGGLPEPPTGPPAGGVTALSRDGGSRAWALPVADEAQAQ